MTNARALYLEKCNSRELKIRRLLRYCKHELKKEKAVCNSHDLKKLGRKPMSYILAICSIKDIKLMITALKKLLPCSRPRTLPMPCPFCGGKIEIDTKFPHLTKKNRFTVTCRTCGSRSGWHKTPQDAIQAWNKRR